MYLRLETSSIDKIDVQELGGDQCLVKVTVKARMNALEVGQLARLLNVVTATTFEEMQKELPFDSDEPEESDEVQTRFEASLTR